MAFDTDMAADAADAVEAHMDCTAVEGCTSLGGVRDEVAAVAGAVLLVLVG